MANHTIRIDNFRPWSVNPPLVHADDCSCPDCHDIRSKLVRYLSEVLCEVSRGRGSVVFGPDESIGVTVDTPRFSNEMGAMLARRDSNQAPQGPTHNALDGKADQRSSDKPTTGTVDYKGRYPGLPAHLRAVPTDTCRCWHDGKPCQDICAQYCERYDRRASVERGRE